MVKAFCFLILWEKGWQQASSSNLLTPAVFHLMFFWAKGIWTWNFLTFDFKIVDSFFFILRIMPSSPPVLKLATRSSLKKSKYNLYCVKSVQIRSFFWSVFSRIPTEYGKIRKTPGKKYPNKKFLLVPIFPHFDWIRRDTLYLSVLCSNAGKYGPAKTPYLDIFHAAFQFPTPIFSLWAWTFKNIEEYSGFPELSRWKLIQKSVKHLSYSFFHKYLAIFSHAQFWINLCTCRSNLFK